MRNKDRQGASRPFLAFFPRTARAGATRSAAGLLAVALAGLPAAAWAQAEPPTPPAAAALQADLRAWFTTLLAPALTLPAPPLTVTVDGDGYMLSLPVAERAKEAGKGKGKDTPAKPAATAITAHLRPVATGRWSLDDLRVPSDGTFTIDPAAGADAAITYSIAEQTARAVIDLTLATRSSMSLELRDVAFATQIDGQKQAQRFERYALQGTLIPGADGRLDIVQDGTITGWESTTEIAPKQAAETQIRRVRMGMRLDGLHGGKLASAWTAIKALATEVGNGQAPAADAKSLPPVMRQHARALIESLRDIANRIEGEESIDDFSMTLPGVGEISLDQLRFGMGGEAPDGKLRAWADIALEGLDIEALPQGMRDYIPARIALRPVISGISTEKAFALLLAAVGEKPDQNRLAADATALVTDGGASIGLESLSLELDPLRIEGSGRMRMLTPTKAGIEARLSATGLDAMMAEAGKNPDLRMAMPILAMIKGLGRQEGPRMVWDLAITDDQALVNGVDVMAMPAEQPQPQRKPNKR